MLIMANETNVISSETGHNDKKNAMIFFHISADIFYGKLHVRFDEGFTFYPMFAINDTSVRG